MAVKRRGLGRGLDALLGSVSPPESKTSTNPPASIVTAAPAVANASLLQRVPVDLIKRGRYQARLNIDNEGLQDLANSIKAQGVVQPIVLRKLDAQNYELVAGERRWRAAQLAGLAEIPAVVRDVTDEQAMAIGLIENIQREELNPLEEAMAFNRLIDEFEMTHQKVADAVGRSRTTVTNILRLLSLREDVKELLKNRDIEMGHARALLALTGKKQSDAAKIIVAKSLSVRETENLVRRLPGDGKLKKDGEPLQDPNIRRLQQDLSERLGADVNIQHHATGKGKLVITYNSLDELEGIIAHIK